MTLGDFRKITEQYGDDCPLFFARSALNLCDASRVERVLIDIRDTGEDDPLSMTPEIIVL